MNKRAIIWTTVAMLCVASGAYLVWWHNSWNVTLQMSDQDLVDLAKRKNGVPPQPLVAAAVDLTRPVRIAVGNLGFADEEQDRRVGDLVLSELAGVSGLETVERQALDAALRELSLSLAGLVRAKEAVHAGKLLKADWFVLGTQARIGGSNSIIVRIVDAHTGVLRDAGVLPSAESPVRVAAGLAAFVRQGRQNAASARKPVFLAIGAFEDLSANNRQANFSSLLRGSLTMAYRNSSVTLLEREYLDMLLKEVRLDLAGLSETTGADTGTSVQSAFWLVDGDFQSDETSPNSVELDVYILRIFGRAKHRMLHGPVGDALFSKVKDAVDAAFKDSSLAALPTRVAEARAQMAQGKELAQLGMGGLVWPEQFNELDAQHLAKKRRNDLQALQAFETVLLLEPTNREAKLCLAACLRKTTIGQVEEARSYYREVLEEPIQDKWTAQAQQALHFSFRWNTAEERAQWFNSAVTEATNSPAHAFYQAEAKSAEKEILLANGGDKAQQILESSLFNNVTNAMLGNVYGQTGLEKFLESYGTNRAPAAAARLAELYPVFTNKAPQLAPYLMAAIVTAQVDTNASVVVEFGQMLEQFARTPAQVYQPKLFWPHIDYPICNWSFEHGLYEMAAHSMEGILKLSTLYPQENWGSGESLKMNLAFAYFYAHRWQSALEIFETYSNRPVTMPRSGPWGEAFSTVLTGEQTAYCRQKLGLPVQRNPLQFEMSKALVCLCTPSTFRVCDDGLWVGIAGKLLKLDFGLHTNLEVQLPTPPSTSVTSVSVGESKIWLATDGAGLLEFDKVTHNCKHFTVEDGLMQNVISCLQLSSDALWIGYGYKAAFNSFREGGGGLGKLDLSTHRFSAFVPSLTRGTRNLKVLEGNLALEPPDGPTRRSIRSLAVEPVGRIWFVTAFHPLRCYHSDSSTWEAVPELLNCSALGFDSRHLVVARFWNYDDSGSAGPLGVSFLNPAEKVWRSLPDYPFLPSGSATALALDGDDLWVGGAGYIARFDLKQNRLRNFAYIPAQWVDHLQLGGGYLWAQYDWHLHQVLLSGL